MQSNRVKCVTYAVCLAVRSKSSRLPYDSFAKYWLGRFNHHLCRSAGDRRRFQYPSTTTLDTRFSCAETALHACRHRVVRGSILLRLVAHPLDSPSDPLNRLRSTAVVCNHHVVTARMMSSVCRPKSAFFLSRKNGIRGSTATGRAPAGVRFGLIIEETSPVMRMMPQARSPS